MLNGLWLIPILPFLGFLALALFGHRLAPVYTAIVGVGSVGISAILALLVAASYIVVPPPDNAFVQTLWTWMQVGGFNPGITLYLDPLALVFVVVVTFVGFLIHLYSAEFMLHDEDYSRFFAYMNLFVGSMLMLVLADNLVLLYLGWEGVGLCSYLLIGYWYKDPANVVAARKAFVVTRVGDTAMAIGLFLLFTNLGTLQIQPLMQHALQQWQVGSALPVAAAALLLGGAVGKSAQLPLQTWLPDAMAGPTPTSALIHAATMVTAGVYLVARTHVLFTLAPAIMTLVAVVGALTLLLAGFSALTQWDIKRILAYSTISQIGYMFLALGVGAWSAGVFHFVTHAFFKALLFLGAGVVILAMHEDHNIFHMGGLRKRLPLTFWTFLIASASLAALPLVTAGFYSKDLIIADSLTSTSGSLWLWIAGLVGAFLTTLYTFRMVFVTFWGEAQHEPIYSPRLPIQIPLVVLALLSIVVGFIDVPGFLRPVLPETVLLPGAEGLGLFSSVATAIAFVFGLFIAYWAYVLRPQVAANVVRNSPGAELHRFWFVGWGFDWLYDRLIVRPFDWFAHHDREDVVDLAYQGIADLARASNRSLARTQTGQLRYYAMGLALGAVLTVAAVVLLWY